MEGSHSGLVPAVAGLESGTGFMFYVYILKSEKDGRYYIGCTSDINMRLAWHNEGKNTSTKYRRPLKLVYNEEFLTKKEAMKRERKIKSYKGGNEFKKLINGGFA